jgi:hypothetical protein
MPKIYRLTRESAPLTFMLASRNTSARRLYYFDGTRNRELRYARNQKSPFVDEQDGNFILEPIIFEDGFLRVEDTNLVLQRFLEVHPDNGALFEEVDNKRDATKELESIEVEIEAMNVARKMEISMMENVARVALEVDPTRISTSELKRDILVYAKNNPEEFLSIANDPQVAHDGLVSKMFDAGILVTKKTAVHFNLSTNKSKMISIPLGETAKSATRAYFLTDEGVDIMKTLEKHLPD